jgi:DtxR family transcriptional regulator, Mn-dependent transcriptional regulator
MEITLTEENYIKAIFSISRSGAEGGVSTNQLSEHLNNKAASITDMLKRLSDKKLIHYRKYQGVVLSTAGEKVALDIIRKHRLWEVFLLDKLDFSWDEVHDIAEQLEHVRSDELVNRLAAYLGNPRFDPHGDPIPDSQGEMRHIKAHPLSECRKKGGYIFTGVTDHSKFFLRHLSSIGLKIGSKIQVQSINEFDRSMQIRINKDDSRFISEKVSSHILVERKK